MEYHNILVLEGGGAKGAIHVGELFEVEKQLNKKLVDFIDLFVTTSIGGVEASVYCTGKLKVGEFWSFLEPNLQDIFTAKYPWSIPRYNWEKYKKIYNQHVGSDIKFGDSKSKFMFTTVDLVTGKNVFPKSWHDEYKDILMPDIVHRTFAAPLYFGGIYDNISKSIWSDGGVGFFNLPLMEAYTQALSLGWLAKGHRTHILALGTGRTEYKLDYDRESKKGKVRKSIMEVRRFFSKDQGGIARVVSASTQINMMKKLTDNYNNLSFQWVDWFPMSKELDKIDNWEKRWDYFEKGRELGSTIDLAMFKKKFEEK